MDQNRPDGISVYPAISPAGFLTVAGTQSSDASSEKMFLLFLCLE